jgi:hypothetical protein
VHTTEVRTETKDVARLLGICKDFLSSGCSMAPRNLNFLTFELLAFLIPGVTWSPVRGRMEAILLRKHSDSCYSCSSRSFWRKAHTVLPSSGYRDPGQDPTEWVVQEQMPAWGSPENRRLDRGLVSSESNLLPKSVANCYIS